MCGIAGYLGGTPPNEHTGPNIALTKMLSAIQHRGPDSDGLWQATMPTIGLGQKRLAIVDLTEAGAQPMQSACGRYVITFNGEIYNHLKLRAQLPTVTWRGHSDTEVLIESISAIGISATIEKCIGMFAFALWDKHTQTLTLCRDRFGEKPLYYGWLGQGDERVFVFGSELKAIKAHPAFQADIDHSALTSLMRYGYIPAPSSIYQGIYKLEAGCIASVNLSKQDIHITRYWDSAKVAVQQRSKSQMGDAGVLDSLEALLKDAVAQQMMADVPLGAFLSGGVDSSTVVALMQSQSMRPVNTFTIGFSDKTYDEAQHAKLVAQHLGTNHTEMYVSPTEAQAVVSLLPHMYCEPFADSSQIPTYLVSKLARQHVTVSLSGDAGDELFAGYNRYQSSAKLWPKLDRTPPALRSLAAHAIHTLSPDTWTHLADRLPTGHAASKFSNLGDKLHKAAAVLNSRTMDDLYLGLISQTTEPAGWVVDGRESRPPSLFQRADLKGLEDVEKMMVLDTQNYLADDILCKVDRASMSVSLESRVPFLDHRVFEFAWTLPLGYKMREGQTKWPLRQILYRYVPQALMDRPKMGFSIPLHDWLRGPMKAWAEELLDEARIQREGYLHAQPIRQVWQQHLSGKYNHGHKLWPVLMFQAWLEVNH
jgi:asparagine synthase (glutamine-hydrolysing)